MEFAGKVALITGGGGGIGRASAIGFAGRGAKVMVVDIDETSGEASAELVRQRGGDARFVRADVTKSADVQDYVKATLDAYGAIDCFFNNAGIEGKVMPTQESDEAMFDAVIGVNLKGVFLGMRHVLPVMLKQGRGAIVNTASVAGLFGGPGMAPYVASKHGVLGLTKVGVRGCRASRRKGECRMSGAGRDTHDALAGGAAEPSRPAGGRTMQMPPDTPTGRYVMPEEVANVVMYLCSDFASDITGTHIVIDGGRSGSGGAPSASQR